MGNPDSWWHDAPLNNLYAISGPDQPMSDNRPAETSAIPLGGQQHRLEALLGELEALACGLEDQPAALLELLRRLEGLHRQIQEGSFRTSLPAERNQLFQLLQQMEASGGWPYIPRPQLHTFINLMQAAPESASGPQLAGEDGRGAGAGLTAQIPQGG